MTIMIMGMTKMMMKMKSFKLKQNQINLRGSFDQIHIDWYIDNYKYQIKYQHQYIFIFFCLNLHQKSNFSGDSKKIKSEFWAWEERDADKAILSNGKFYSPLNGISYKVLAKWKSWKNELDNKEYSKIIKLQGVFFQWYPLKSWSMENLG